MENSETCSTCARSTIPPDKMGAAGWLVCGLSEKWNYRAAGAKCIFEPSCWQAKAANELARAK